MSRYHSKITRVLEQRQSLFAVLCALFLATIHGTTAWAQTGTVMPVPIAVFYDNNGDPCSGCKLYAFVAGTVTPLDTYSEVTLTTANAHPVVLNSAGRATVFLSANSYSFRLDDAADVTIWTQDNITATHAGVTGASSTTDLTLQVDTDNDGTNVVSFRNGLNVEKAQINESGDLQMDSNLTIGDATEADKDLTFDGNAQDFYVCLDDSADDLVIGLGATCGTTPALAVDANQDVTISQNLVGSASSLWLLNDSANANMTTGLTLNQGGAANEILALKSSDIAHGTTGEAETDTFASMTKVSSTDGGLNIRGLSEGATAGVRIYGIPTTANTTHDATGLGAVRISVALKSGTGVANYTADGNLLTVDNNASTKFIIDAEGDTFQDGTAGTAYSAWDDPMLALAVEHHINPSGVADIFRQYATYNKQSLIDAGILAPDGPNGERGFVNMSALTRLAVGSAWQLGIKAQQQQRRIDALTAENAALAARLTAIEATLARTAQALGQ